MDDGEYIVAIIGIIIALILGVMIGNAIADGPKFCPECGERYDTNAVYCDRCGVELLERGK